MYFLLRNIFFLGHSFRSYLYLACRCWILQSSVPWNHHRPFSWTFYDGLLYSKIFSNEQKPILSNLTSCTMTRMTYRPSPSIPVAPRVRQKHLNFSTGSLQFCSFRFASSLMLEFARSLAVLGRFFFIFWNLCIWINITKWVIPALKVIINF